MKNDIDFKKTLPWLLAIGIGGFIYFKSRQKNDDKAIEEAIKTGISAGAVGMIASAAMPSCPPCAAALAASSRVLL